MHERAIYTVVHGKQFPLTYQPNNTQASGAEFDMVMSTKEQETFETSLAASDGFESIKAGLSRVDVRQVRIPPKLGCCPQGPGCDHTSHPSG